MHDFVYRWLMRLGETADAICRVFCRRLAEWHDRVLTERAKGLEHAEEA